MVLSAKVKKESQNKVVNLKVPRPHPKTKKRKFRLGGPTVILFILLGFIFYSFGGQAIEMYNVRHEITKIREQMDELKAKNTELRKQVDQLNSNAYIEREAREKLGYVKPGEKIILEAQPGAASSLGSGGSAKRSNPEIH